MSDQEKLLKDVTQGDYKYGFYTDIEADSVPKGLNEDVIRLISAKKNEPEWLLEFRLKSLQVLAKYEDAALASPEVAGDRLPGYHILFST